MEMDSRAEEGPILFFILEASLLLCVSDGAFPV